MVRKALCAVVLVLATAAIAQESKPEAPSFAEVAVGPNSTVVIVRDTRGADQMIVTTFFWQKLPGIEKPIMRSVTDVVPVIKDTAVAANGPQNPADVTSVHVSLIKITDRLEWKPTEKVTPAK